MSIENKIRLNALNNVDLKIFSFLCQDAIISKEEIFYDKTKKLFVATLTRYCWEQQELNDKNINYRVVTGMQFNNVNNVEYISIKSLTDIIICEKLRGIAVATDRSPLSGSC